MDNSKGILATVVVLIIVVAVGGFVYYKMSNDTSSVPAPVGVVTKKSPDVAKTPTDGGGTTAADPGAGGYKVIKREESDGKNLIYILISSKDVGNKDKTQANTMAIAKTECKGYGCNVLFYDTQAAFEFQQNLNANKLSQDDLAAGLPIFSQHYVALVIPDSTESFQYYPAKQ